MKLAFYSTGKPRESRMIAALRSAGHDVLERLDGNFCPKAELHLVPGIGQPDLIGMLERWSVPYLFLDKGYNRDFPQWWRFSFGGHQPVEFVARSSYGVDRARAQGWLDRIEPWVRSRPSDCILLAGSSPKYHEFAGLSYPTDWAMLVIEYCKAVSSRPIVYRPKPQWRDAEEIKGAAFSHVDHKVKGRRIRADLECAHVMITHASSACLEALLAGVPTICLGQAPVRSISSTWLGALEQPHVATDEERLQIISNLAYCQWSLDEIAEGTAWPHIEKQMR